MNWLRPFQGHPVRRSLLALLVALTLSPQAAQACAVCYGQSDSPMAAGMNWGILTLLGFIVSVLVAIAAFFVFLARKSAADSRAAAVENLLQPAQQD